MAYDVKNVESSIVKYFKNRSKAETFNKLRFNQYAKKTPLQYIKT